MKGAVYTVLELKDATANLIRNIAPIELQTRRIYKQAGPFATFGVT
jgi:hypothetical protein